MDSSRYSYTKLEAADSRPFRRLFIGLGASNFGRMSSIGAQFRMPWGSRMIYEAEPPIIRILILHPGSETDHISCTLESHDLRAAPDFEALSYTWGGETRQINCCGRAFSITANLYSALVHLRHPAAERVLWVDAICINQDDTIEKDSQIQIMGNIYSWAERVLIWLGDEHRSDSGAIDMIDGMKKYLEKLSEMTDLEAKEIIQEAVQDQNLPEDGWKHIGSLLKRSYFRRLWVIQEVVNAREAIIICGKKSVSWSCFTLIINLLTRLMGQDYDYGESIGLPESVSLLKSNPLLIHSLRRSKGPGKGFGIFDLLWNTRAFEASNPRDRIFALIGLPIQEGELVPMIDSSMSVLDTFRHFTLLELLHARGANSLSFVNLDAVDKDPAITSPSWVPDLGFCEESTAPIFLIMAWGHGISASGKTSTEARVSEDKVILSIKGRRTECVEFVAVTRASIYKEESLEAPTSKLDITDNRVVETERSWLSCCLWVLFGSSPIILDEFFQSEAFEIFIRYLCHGWDFHTQSSPSLELIYELKLAIVKLFTKVDDWDPKNAHRRTVLRSHTIYKSFCRLGDNFIGWLPANAAVGDVVCVFNGAKVPHLLRPLDDVYYHLMGECYIGGLMHGEILAMDKYREEELRIS